MKKIFTSQLGSYSFLLANSITLSTAFIDSSVVANILVVSETYVVILTT